MKTPLIPEEGDPRWEFVGNVLRIFDKRKARQIVSKHGIKPLSDSIAMLKIVLLAMCFETDITFVISELRGKASLREFTSVHDVPDAEDIYRILSRFTLDQFMNMVLRIVNTVCGKRKRGKTIIIGDTTNLTVDLNWLRKKYKKEDLKDTDYKWAYSKSKGYYIGMKLVLAIEYPSLKPLAFLVFPGGPSDSKIFDKIVAELMRRRILRKGDMFVLDKGFYAYKHYTDGLLKYDIIPLIFPRKNFKIEKVLNSIQLTLDFFCDKADRIKMKIRNLKAILSEFKQNILNWKEFKPKRSLIEDVIKVMKKTFSLDKIHRFTLPSVTKQASLGVVLLGIAISFGYKEKKQLQMLAEW
jgi:hypothetical protein